MPAPKTVEDLLKKYEHLVVLDTEFSAPSGSRPRPVSAVAYSLAERRRYRVWCFNQRIEKPPWPDTPDTLTVVWFGGAEFGFYQSMKWRLPSHVVDLYGEYLLFKNGRKLSYGNMGNSLANAMQTFGLSFMDSQEKQDWRQLIIDLSWAPEQIPGILDYNEADVLATTQLLHKMMPLIDFPRALFRGDYVKSMSLVEQRGVPVDVETLRKIQEAWPRLKEQLIGRANQIFPFYDEDQVFKLKKFSKFLKREKIPWQRTSRGPVTRAEYMEEKAKFYPQIYTLREIRVTIDKFKSLKLPIGLDGRNRFLISPFKSLTGRNQPKASQNIFSFPKWFRNLIRPEFGRAMAYVDWSAAEFGEAAFLSGDELMMECYRAEDPYLYFAMMSDFAPEGATKKTEPVVRSQFKELCLGMQYGQGVRGIARRLHISEFRAKRLHKLHRRTFGRFWQWSDAMVNNAILYRKIQAPLGWAYHVRSREFDENGHKKGPEVLTLRNWPMQSAGSEMMRAASIFLADEGIETNAIVHDAFLISSPVNQIEETVKRTRCCMDKASSLVLGGNALKTDAEVFEHPQRFPEDRGKDIWRMLLEFLDQPEPKFALK